MTSAKLPDRILDPMDRISVVLFGLIMALTFTCTLGVAIADNIQVRTMLIGALECNLAWGIIDGGVYLMARLNERGPALISWHAVRDTAKCRYRATDYRGCVTKVAGVGSGVGAAGIDTTEPPAVARA
jgi:hypothetical protein